MSSYLCKLFHTRVTNTGDLCLEAYYMMVDLMETICFYHVERAIQSCLFNGSNNVMAPVTSFLIQTVIVLLYILPPVPFGLGKK